MPALMKSPRDVHRTIVLISLLVLSSVAVSKAQMDTDTLVHLQEVFVTIYPSKVNLLQSPSSVGILGKAQLKLQPGYSLVPAMNTLPGVRMEERSPGSYRLSIRGSLLRSPFGIRNVKIYMNEFPLTDAGGNTYLNALDAGSMEHIEILKGPEGSLFGANTGGVVLIGKAGAQDSAQQDQASVHLSGGSFGLFQERVSWQKRFKQYQVQVLQSFQRSDGYRQNSALQKHYLQASQSWIYHPGLTVKLLTLYSDHRYQTPGGLTIAQMRSNPQSARPRAGSTPGASEQKAGVINKTFFGGLSHEALIEKKIRHVAAVFGSHTNFENPFITNYEVRKEGTYGLRTYLEYISKPGTNFGWQWNLGLEWQRTNTKDNNYGNKLGNKDTIQSLADVAATQHFYFTRLSFDITQRWVVETAVSLNYFQYRYKYYYPVLQTSYSEVNFNPQLMPRVAASYKITTHMAWRTSISRGYSTPTIAEIHPSDNSFYTNLQPENGWNYETGLRLLSYNERLYADLAVFHYSLHKAIVKRVNENSQDYYVNAGGTKQQGLESQVVIQLIPARENHFLRSLKLQNSTTYYNFSFRDYLSAGANYSGNRLTGVPRFTTVSAVNCSFPAHVSLYVQYNCTGKTPLNDANTFFASSYHLVQFKASKKFIFPGNSILEVYCGTDNLLNQSYSLGNDLNAARDRYYNPAPLRNYYGGFLLTFK